MSEVLRSYLDCCFYIVNGFLTLMTKLQLLLYQMSTFLGAAIVCGVAALRVTNKCYLYFTLLGSG